MCTTIYRYRKTVLKFLAHPLQPAAAPHATPISVRFTKATGVWLVTSSRTTFSRLVQHAANAACRRHDVWTDVYMKE
jgi:hypothetical protein